MTRHTQPIVERLFRPMERSTRQRSSIRTVMEEAGRPLLPAEILGAAQREVPAIGLATVYRNIKQLMEAGEVQDRKSTRLNSSHSQISYAVFCLKKKKTTSTTAPGCRCSSCKSSPSYRPSGR